ncbi:protein YgfX [Thiobaca trueperi]|uniref:Toxin CptA n=1 Tax=Thiobaca trueperi TaxID=127458 RepID=A0A4R3MUJ4_9GAMM|nr:protein YgfX [Thiobaca trueperi]TCT19417.1 toxin CptA [Thiobaca trueperi]
MGAHRERPPLLIRPRRSRQLAIFVGLVHGLAFVVVLALPIGLYRLPLLLLIGLGCFRVISAQVLRRSPRSIQTALWQSDGSWFLTFVDGRQQEVTLSPSTFVSLSLVVLNFRAGRLRRYAIPLFRDALDPETLRRLRQRLRSDGAVSAPDPDAV